MSGIVDKLQKLMSMERSTRGIGSIAEAEAFAAKIQTLLTQHKLTMSDVEFEAQDTVDPIGQEDVSFEGRSTPNWQFYLSTSISRNFFCCVFGVARENRQTFVGRDSDRKAAVEMYRYLVGLATSLAKIEGEAYMNNPRIQAWVIGARKTLTSGDLARVLRKIKRDFETSFLIGFGLAIFNRLDSTRKDLEATASIQASGLILRDKAAIDKYASDRFGTKTQRRKPKAASATGLQAGFDHGNAVSLKSRTALSVGT